MKQQSYSGYTVSYFRTAFWANLTVSLTRRQNNGPALGPFASATEVEAYMQRWYPHVGHMGYAPSALRRMNVVTRRQPDVVI